MGSKLSWKESQDSYDAVFRFKRKYGRTGIRDVKVTDNDNNVIRKEELEVTICEESQGRDEVIRVYIEWKDKHYRNEGLYEYYSTLFRKMECSGELLIIFNDNNVIEIN